MRKHEIRNAKSETAKNLVLRTLKRVDPRPRFLKRDCDFFPEGKEGQPNATGWRRQAPPVESVERRNRGRGSTKRFFPGLSETAGRQRGDTIVEVLIALSAIGLTLAAAFALSNLAFRAGRLAQERTEALKIAESQVELIKLHYNADPARYDAFTPSDIFCIDETKDPGMGEVAAQGSPEYDTVCQEISGHGDDGLYTVEVTPNTSPRTYQVVVTWDRPGTVDGIVDVYYRVGVL